MKKVRFDAQIAAGYDEASADVYRPELLDRAVDFLAELAGDGATLELGFDEYTDFAGQILYSHHYWIDDGRLRSFSAPYRYVWPAELDLMARLAGMTLRERWAGWTREPFTDASTSHVSVWEKARK